MMDALDRYKGSKLPMTSLLASSVGADIGLSDSQKATLIRTCNEVNSEVQKILDDSKERTNKLRSELVDTYSETLTASQKSKFEKNVPVKKLLKGMDLSEIKKDTSFFEATRN